MSEPSVSYLVRDLAEETSGWLQAEVVNLRCEIDARFEELRVMSMRLAIGIVFVALGLQMLLAALIVWIALGLELGWTVAFGSVGLVASTLGLSALVTARPRRRR